VLLRGYTLTTAQLTAAAPEADDAAPAARA